MAAHGLPFVPQGFQTLGPHGQQQLAAQGITLSVQHDPKCRHSRTDITYTLDITAFQERSRRQGIFRILDSHLEGHGCLCGADPLSTSALNEKMRNATAPPQAMPFILRATQEWPEELASQDPATPVDRMNVHHGGLENSIHRTDTVVPLRSPPRPNTETTYPPPPGGVPTPPATSPYARKPRAKSTPGPITDGPFEPAGTLNVPSHPPLRPPTPVTLSLAEAADTDTLRPSSNATPNGGRTRSSDTNHGRPPRAHE